MYCSAEGCEGGLVKPDITFFGESLPARFFQRKYMASEADLIIVMGTSLQVGPFNELPDDVPVTTPRLLINRDRVGSFGYRSDDVIWLDDCDASVRDLAEALGWTQELEEDWIGVVGAEEAEIQKNGVRMCVEDDVARLAERIDHVHIEDELDANQSYSLHEEADTARERSGSSSGIGERLPPEDQDGALDTLSGKEAGQLVDSAKTESADGAANVEGVEEVLVVIDPNALAQPIGSLKVEDVKENEMAPSVLPGQGSSQ